MWAPFSSLKGYVKTTFFRFPGFFFFTGAKIGGKNVTLSTSGPTRTMVVRWWTAGEERYLMFRKLLFFFAAPAFLSLLTAGTLQARPLAGHLMAPTGLQELWHWVISGPEMWTKEGGAMDPNGGQKVHGHNPGRPPHETGTRSDRAAAKGR
jgi:hypothetical protein